MEQAGRCSWQQGKGTGIRSKVGYRQGRKPKAGWVGRHKAIRQFLSWWGNTGWAGWGWGGQAPTPGSSSHGRFLSGQRYNGMCSYRMAQGCRFQQPPGEPGTSIQRRLLLLLSGKAMVGGVARHGLGKTSSILPGGRAARVQIQGQNAALSSHNKQQGANVTKAKGKRTKTRGKCAPMSCRRDLNDGHTDEDEHLDKGRQNI